MNCELNSEPVFANLPIKKLSKTQRNRVSLQFTDRVFGTIRSALQTLEYSVGSNNSLLSFMSHSFRSFGLSGNLNVLTLDLEFFLQFIAAQNTIIFR